MQAGGQALSGAETGARGRHLGVVAHKAGPRAQAMKVGPVMHGGLGEMLQRIINE